MSTLTIEIFNEMIEKFSTPFIGLTSQPHIFRILEESNKQQSPFFAYPTQVIPHYSVWNQPCELVKWTSQKVMMRYVQRKDSETLKSAPSAGEKEEG